MDIKGRKEGNVSFKDTFNTFCLVIGIGHMVMVHPDSERGNLLAPLHELLFPISIMVSFICKIPDRIAHTKAFVTPDMVYWLNHEIAQWVYHEGRKHFI